MYALGFSLNNLTLMALTISTGFVVDDAIVMIENITRYVEQGEAPLAAALKGAEQIGFTIMSLTVSLIAVLIPLLFMGDITGPPLPGVRRDAERDDPHLRRRLAHPDADAVREAPPPQGGVAAGPLLQGLGEDVRAKRSPSTGGRSTGCSRHRTLTLVVAVATLVLTLFLYVVIPKGFFPSRTRARSRVCPRRTRAFRSRRWRGCSSSWPRSSSRIPRSRASPRSSASTGRTRPSTAAGSRSTSSPSRSGESRAPNVIRRLQASLAKVQGISLYMQPVQDISVEDIVSRTEYQYSLQDPSADELSAYATKFVGPAERDPRAGGRGERPADPGAPGIALVRPPDRVPPGNHPAEHRRQPLRQLRAEAGLDGLHPAEPVPRHPGGGPALPDEPGAAEGHLPHLGQRAARSR